MKYLNGEIVSAPIMSKGIFESEPKIVGTIYYASYADKIESFYDEATAKKWIESMRGKGMNFNDFIKDMVEIAVLYKKRNDPTSFNYAYGSGMIQAITDICEYLSVDVIDMIKEISNQSDPYLDFCDDCVKVC